MKNKNIWVFLGRSGIVGNWDDGYEFEGTLEDLGEFLSGIINTLDDDERKIILDILNLEEKQ